MIPRPWAKIFGAIAARLDGDAGSLPAATVPGGISAVSAVARENRDPYRVLVATMISLRTRDEVTCAAADRLLAAAPGPA